MSDKTLVERLRDLQNGDYSYITQCEFVRAVGAKCPREMQGYGCNLCLNVTAKAIADAIEREYLPRPRYEDGEPVQFGDAYTDKYGTAWLNGIRSIHIDCNGEFSLRGHTLGHSGMFADFGRNERVKRPEPEVLDADGVPIKVGDTVYFVLDPEPLRVVGIDNYGFVICEGKKDSTFPYPDVLTHKEPDSLERIEADAIKTTRDYWGCFDTECRNCTVTVDGKRPYEYYPVDGKNCISAQKLDLLRRQREVLERDHER